LLQWTLNEKFRCLAGDKGERVRPYYTLMIEVPNGRLYQRFRNSDTSRPYDSNSGADQTGTNQSGACRERRLTFTEISPPG
jgi:hypothetical protein